MLDKLKKKTVYLYQQPVDFRKQVYGLVQIAVDALEIKGIQDSIVIFQNQKKDKVKLVLWDRNGFVMLYKILEKGRFDFGKREDGQLEISYDELKMLVSGMPILQLGTDKNTMKFH